MTIDKLKKILQKGEGIEVEFNPNYAIGIMCRILISNAMH